MRGKIGQPSDLNLGPADALIPYFTKSVLGIMT